MDDKKLVGVLELFYAKYVLDHNMKMRNIYELDKLPLFLLLLEDKLYKSFELEPFGLEFKIDMHSKGYLEITCEDIACLTTRAKMGVLRRGVDIQWETYQDVLNKEEYGYIIALVNKYGMEDYNTLVDLILNSGIINGTEKINTVPMVFNINDLK